MREVTAHFEISTDTGSQIAWLLIDERPAVGLTEAGLVGLIDLARGALAAMRRQRADYLLVNQFTLNKYHLMRKGTFSPTGATLCGRRATRELSWFQEPLLRDFGRENDCQRCARVWRREVEGEEQQVVTR